MHSQFAPSVARGPANGVPTGSVGLASRSAAPVMWPAGYSPSRSQVLSAPAPRFDTFTSFASSSHPAGTGGVGITFMDRRGPGGLTEVFAKSIAEGSAADKSGRVKPGDILVEVNGEDVDGLDIASLSKLVPGKVGTAVVLGFRSADNNAYYDVELVREESKLGPQQLVQLERETIAQPDFGETVIDDGPEPMTGMGPQASPGFSIQKGVLGFTVANVTRGSSAERNGFRHGEVIEAIDNIKTADWSENRIKKALTGPYGTLVQVHTDLRIVPVVRDCAPMYEREVAPPAGPPQQQAQAVSMMSPAIYQSEAPPGAQATLQPYQRQYSTLQGANPGGLTAADVYGAGASAGYTPASMGPGPAGSSAGGYISLEGPPISGAFAQQLPYAQPQPQAQPQQQQQQQGFVSQPYGQAPMASQVPHGAPTSQQQFGVEQLPMYSTLQNSPFGGDYF